MISKGHITWYGVSQETFNEKETSHMVDVKALYQNALRFAKTALIILVLIILYFTGMKKIDVCVFE